VRYSALERMADRLVVGEIPSLIVSGPPGLGKSYTLKGAIDRHAGDVDDENVFGNRVMDWVGGSISSVGLYKALYACRDGGVLVLDDCDDVFRDEVSLNLLKVALDSKQGARRVVAQGVDVAHHGRHPRPLRLPGPRVLHHQHRLRGRHPDRPPRRGALQGPHRPQHVPVPDAAHAPATS
jgi:hypothetical protein